MTGIRNVDLASAWDDNYGTSALEFAIVAPVFITLVIGTFFLCMGLFVVASMHFAVEEGARCASINQAVCSNATATIAFAKSRYYGPSGAMPAFTYNAAAEWLSGVWSFDESPIIGLMYVNYPIGRIWLPFWGSLPVRCLAVAPHPR